jgi:hypothetical protein
MADVPLAAWQMQGLVRLFQRLLLPAHAADPTAPMPPPGVLVALYDPAAAPTATVTWLPDIEVHVTLPDGQRVPLRGEALRWCLLHSPALIRSVEPVTPTLAFVLYVHDLLWAWDFRPLGAALAADLARTLLRTGPAPAQTPPRHPLRQCIIKLTGSSRGKSPLGRRHFLPYARPKYYIM